MHGSKFTKFLSLFRHNFSPYEHLKNVSSIQSSVYSNNYDRRFLTYRFTHSFIFKNVIPSFTSFTQQMRHVSVYHVDKPDPRNVKENLRYKVHYPEDGKYTIVPLRVSKLGGRDQKTGRVIFGRIGGGHKQKFRWVKLDRLPPGSVDPLIERVIHIQYDPMRSAKLALVGHGDQLRYLIASNTMKKGDLITSTRFLPRNPIRPKEGDAHPIGALPVGTEICCIEKLPHQGAQVRINGGCFAVISRKMDGKVLVQLDPYQEIALDPECLVTVGRVSNENHSKKVIGSAQRARWLGIRPSSGLKQKKDGRFGYRPKTVKPVMHFEPEKPPERIMHLFLYSEQYRKPVIPSTNRKS